MVGNELEIKKIIHKLPENKVLIEMTSVIRI